MTETTTTAPARTNWPWHLKITYTDGTVREDDYASGIDPIGYAKHLSSKPNVARVELTTVLVGGEHVSPAADEVRVAPWSDVRAGDTVLHYGRLTRVQKGRRSVLLDGSWYYPREGDLTAVQRSKECTR